ncbi:hypothetical protein FACS189450_05880 [Spirochaetia bacterium]|nr:hypothetical protein FACS189450_05880 [Spirochaetia bacterium]
MKTRIALLLISALLLTQCNNFIHELIPPAPGEEPPSPPAILTFKTTAPETAIGVIDQAKRTIRLNVPGGTDVGDMYTDITTLPAPAAATLSPSRTGPTNFSRSVRYTVSYGGISKTYLVTVTVGTAPPPVIRTVTFDKNNGDAGSTEANPQMMPVEQDGVINPLPTAPARPGYSFAGWNRAANGSGTMFNSSTRVRGNITVYAQWTINTCTVTFNKNGGDTDASPASNTTTYGGTVPLPATAPVWAGRAFLNWWTENGSGGNWGTEFTASTPVTQNITVYAKWNPPPNYYTVTFNKNNTDSGSTEANPQTAFVADNGTVNPLPVQPVRTGYTFGGWWTANGSGGNWGTEFTASTPVAANITVYAKWTANIYTVTFDKNGGTTDAVPAAKTVIVPATRIDALPTTVPTWASHTFEGWWTESGDNGNWGTAFTALTPVTQNITVYAKWNPPPNYYMVTFDKNNTDSGSTEADPETAFVADGGTVSPLPAPPVRTGYTFGGWYESADGGVTLGAGFTVATTVTANITVYAKWTANTYTVTFDKNGGDTDAIPASRSVTHGGTVPLPATVPTWAGHTFEGWWTKNGDGNDWGVPFIASTPVTQNITVYARWTPPPNYYTVTFNKNNTDSGSTEANPQTAFVADGGTVNPLPTQPVRTGYTFAGWNTAANGSGTVFDATTTVMGNITVYAQWTINTYTVTFAKNNTDSGSTEASPNTLGPVTHGGTVSPLPTPPARTGYTFGGWNSAANGSGTVFDATTMVTGNITVYAQWTINTYTVTFDKNNTDSGSTEANPQTAVVADGGTVNPLPTAPTRTGYTFSGWNTAADGSGTVFDATTMVTGNITVYAQWTINTYTVTFDKQSGTGGTDSVTATYGAAMPGGTAPSRTGYAFGGYWTAVNGGGTQYYTDTMASACNWDLTTATTLYAKWTVNTYTVTFDKNNTDSDSTEANPQTAVVADGGTVNPLPTQPVRTGYIFVGWNTEADGSGTAFDETTAVIGDITVYAEWAVHYLAIVYTDGSTETIPVSGGAYTLPVNSKTFYSFTFSAPNYPTTPILIGRRADGSAVTLAFNPTSPYALKLQDPIVGGPFDGYRPINTFAEFQLIRVALNGSYVQEADLDLLGNTTNAGGPQPTEQNWTPIGLNTAQFTGNFDGNGKTILNLIINTSGYAGLFGCSIGFLRNIHIGASSSVSGSILSYVGGICAFNNGLITTCSNAGAVSGALDALVGGICAFNYGFITACSNTGNVSGSSDSLDYGLVGGICGRNYNSGTITACYNTGAVSGTIYAGGICGENYNSGTITACYNTGAVSGTVGPNIGGICGRKSGTITACYWLDRPGANAPTFGIGNPASNTNAAKFSGTAWPSITDNPEWGIGTGGSGGYWKSSLGSWVPGLVGGIDGAGSEFPKLYWEP